MIFSRAFANYTRELALPEYNKLSKEEERELLVQMSSGSVVAKNRLIKAHLRFVVYLLRDIKIPQRFDSMDLVQEGNLGFLEALGKFNYEVYSSRVATYSMYYIRWYIFRALGIDTKDIFEHNLSEEFDLDSFESTEVHNMEQEVHTDILTQITPLLGKRELKVMSLLYGLEYPYKALTMREVGSMMHIESETVRLIRNKVIEDLRVNAKFLKN